MGGGRARVHRPEQPRKTVAPNGGRRRQSAQRHGHVFHTGVQTAHTDGGDEQVSNVLAPRAVPEQAGAERHLRESGGRHGQQRRQVHIVDIHVRVQRT